MARRRVGGKPKVARKKVVVWEPPKAVTVTAKRVTRSATPPRRRDIVLFVPDVPVTGRAGPGLDDPPPDCYQCLGDDAHLHGSTLYQFGRPLF